MCRYAFHTYKSHFACFSCRKAFKKIAFEDYIKNTLQQSIYEKLLREIRKRNQNPQALHSLEEKYNTNMAQIHQEYIATVSVCPQCKNTMEYMGLDFQAPPQHEVKRWKILQHLAERNYKFHNCGCGCDYSPPNSLNELEDWFKQLAPKSQGEKLLNNIQRKFR